jgi:hypothetical protein
MADLTHSNRALSAAEGGALAMPLTQYARVAAHRKHFGAKGGEAVARLGVAQAELEQTERAWTHHFAERAAEDDVDDLTTFGLAFAAERARLREEKPPIESLGPLVPKVSEQASGIASPPSNDFVQQATPAAPRPPESTTRDVSQIPTYVREERPPVVVRPEATPRTLSVDETAMMRSPYVAKPAVPFSGTTTAERLAQLVPASAPSGMAHDADVGETALMVSPFAKSEATPFQSAGAPEPRSPPTGTGPRPNTSLAPPLPLERYADLRAAIVEAGEDDSTVLARFGIASPEEHRRLKERFLEYFQRVPHAQDQFLAMLRDRHKKSRR